MVACTGRRQYIHHNMFFWNKCNLIWFNLKVVFIQSGQFMKRLYDVPVAKVRQGDRPSQVWASCVGEWELIQPSSLYHTVMDSSWWCKICDRGKGREGKGREGEEEEDQVGFGVLIPKSSLCPKPLRPPPPLQFGHYILIFIIDFC